MDYDIIRKFWDERRNAGSFLWHNDLTSLNIEIVRKLIPTGAKVLDLGAGNGQIAKALSEECEVLAVDYVPDYISQINSIQYEVCDLRNFTTHKKFDAILLIGVANYFDDSDLESLYAKLAMALEDKGLLIIKHQCALSSRKVVAGSQDLGENYQAVYRTVAEDSSLLLKAGLNVVIKDAYPPEYNTWPDSKFKLIIASKP